MNYFKKLRRLTIVLCAVILAMALMIAQLTLLADGLPMSILPLPGQAAQAAHAGITRLASQLSSTLGTVATSLIDTLGLAPSTVRAIQGTGLQTTLWLALLGFIVLILARRRSERVQAALVVAVILSMVATPLLQVQQAYAYGRQAGQSARQARSRPMTLAEIDAAFNRALQTYLNMPADLSPLEQKLVEATLESQIENLVKQRQALMTSDGTTTPSDGRDEPAAPDVSTPAEAAPGGDATLRGLEGQVSNAATIASPFTAPKPYESMPASRPDLVPPSLGPDEGTYVWGMQAQNEETGQAASWLMTAQPQGDSKVFDEAFSVAIQNGRGEPAAGQDLSASTEQKLTTADAVLRQLNHTINNPTDDEKPASSLAVNATRPSGQVNVVVPKIEILDNCESGDAEWRLDVTIGGTKKEWDKDGVEDTWYDLNWTVPVALADDLATIDFETGGYEEDTFSDDDLPSESWSHDSSDNWGIGEGGTCSGDPSTWPTDRCRNLGPSDGCEYNLYYNVEPADPLFADLELVSITANPGSGTVDYTIKVKNHGPYDTNAEATLSPGSGLSCSTCSSTTTISANQEHDFTITTDVTAGTTGDVTSSATVSTNQSNREDPNTGNNGPKSTTIKFIDLELVSISAPSQAGAGGELEYTVKVKNHGSDGTKAKVTLDLGSGLSYKSASGISCNASGSTVNCSLDWITGGAEAQFTIATDVASDTTGQVESSATVAVDQSGLSDSDTGNNSKSVTTDVVPNADLKVNTDIPTVLTKNNSGDTAFNFTATVVNDGGPSQAAGVTFTDTLPAGVTFNSATPSQGNCSQSGGVVTCDLGDINKDANATVDIALTVPANQTVGTQLTNVAEVSGDGVDSDRSNNSETRNTGLTYWDTAVGDPGLDGTVNALAAGSTYAGGTFSGNVKQWEPAVGSWSALGGGPGGTVHALAVNGTTVYAGGDFTGKIKQWEPAVGSWSALGSGLNGTVHALAVSGNTLYAGGDFTDAGGVSGADRIARWTGSAWEPFGALDGTVRAIAAAEGDVYAGGDFTGKVARWAGDGWEILKDDNNPFGLGGTVYALAVIGPDLYAGGSFPSPVDGQSRGLARWDGSQWHDVAGGVTRSGGSTVYALAANGSDLYVGGFFDSAGGVAANNVARWNGAEWSALEGGTLDRVKSLAISGGSVYVGGQFIEAKTAAPASANFTTNRITRWMPPTTNLSVSQSAAPGQVSPNGNVTFQLTVNNQGSDAKGVAVRDVLPAGFSFQSQTGCTSHSISTGGGSGKNVTSVACELGNLGNGASKTVQIVATAPGITGQYTNRAFVGADETEVDGTDNYDTAVVTVALLTDLVLTKSAPASIKAGQRLTYTLTASNDGPEDAPNVVVSDTLPAGVTYVSATPSQGSACTQAEGVVSCALGQINQSASAIISIVVDTDATLAADAQLVNRAGLTAGAIDANAGDTTPSRTTDVTVDADLVATKSAPATVHKSASLVYELTVTNAGPSQAAGVLLNDQLPAGTVFETVTRPGVTPHGCLYDSDNHAVNCNVGVLEPGASATYQIEVSLNQSLTDGTTLTNTATATADSPDSKSDNDSATTETTVTTAEPGTLEAEMELSKSAPATVGAGGVLTFTLQATNNGPLNATNVEVTDPVPAGTTFEASASSTSCTESGGTVTCDLGTLAAGQTGTAYVAVRVPKTTPKDTEISNTATVSADQADSNAGNDSASAGTTVVLEADVAVTKTATASVNAGQDVVYSLTATNHGPSDATGVVLSDTLPSGVVFKSATSCSESDGVVTCDIGPLPAGTSFNVDITVTTFNAGSIRNTASAAGTTSDPETENNTASAGTDVGQPARQTRDVGNFQVTANAFVDRGGGKVEAFGDITLGDHYKLSGTGDKVTIQDSQLTGNGTLTLIDGDLALFTGDFSADGSTSPPLLTPDANVSYKLNKIGGFSVKTGLMLSQVNLSSGRADGSATLRVNPPGLDKSVSASFNITPGPTYAGTVSDFDFVIAGFSVSVTSATITNKGIGVNPVTLTGPAKFGAKTSQVSNFQITANGLNVGGTGSSFPLPDIYVADNAPTSTILIKDAKATLAYVAGNYVMNASGVLSVILPGNSTSANVSVRFDSQGNVSASVKKLQLKVAGSTLDLKDLALTNDGLSAATGALKLDLVLIFKGPLYGSTPATMVKDVKITADGLDIPGNFALPTAYLGVNNYIKFTGLSAAFVVSETVAPAHVYVMEVHGKVTLDLPGNEHQDLDFTAKIDDKGHFKGVVNEVYVELKVGPADVRLWNVVVYDDGLETDEARVRMAWKKDPDCDWGADSCGPGAVQAAVDKLKIGADGIDFDAFRLGFRISDKITIWEKKLVVTDAFMVFELPGPGKASEDFAPGVGIEGTATITVGKVSAVATGRLIVDAFGNLRGTLEGFGLTVAGLGVKIDRAKFENDIIFVQQASLIVPKSWGGLEVEVYNLEIGPDRFKIGGGKFALPDIKVGKIKLAGLYGEMIPVGDGYEIGAAGTFLIPGLGGGKGCGIKVGVFLYTDAFGALVMQIDTLEEGQPETAMAPQGADAVNSLALKRVLVGLDGCAIPIGTTGFYVNRVEGSLTLNQGTTRIEIGVTVVGGPSFAGFYAVQGDVDMGLQFEPFQFDLTGAITLFAIFKAAQLQATAKQDFFSAEVKINQLLVAPVPMSVTAEGSLTVWTTDGDFHLVGKLVVTFGLKEGSWGTLDVGLFDIDLPPWTVTLAEVGVEFGEFVKGDGSVWGFKGWVTIWKFTVGFYIDTDGDVDIGDVDSYKTVTPPEFQQARRLWRAMQEGRLQRAALNDAEEALLRDFAFTQDATFIDVTVPAPTDVLFGLQRAGDEPTLTILDPGGQEIRPDNLPDNVIYDTLEVTRTEGAAVVTDTLTIYSVGDAQPGTWQIKLVGEMGTHDALSVAGANPPPVLEQVSATATGPASAQVGWALTSDEVTTTLNIWATPGPITETRVITTTEGLTKEVTSEVFTGFPVAKNVTTKVDGTLNSTMLDLSDLESGTYHLWFEADDGNNPPTRAYAGIPVQVQQAWQEIWTANTTATPSFGEVEVNWDSHPNPDVDGYEVLIGTLLGVAERAEEVGDTLAATISGLEPDTTYYLSVVAVDEDADPRRESTSEWISFTTDSAPFSLSASQSDFTLAGGTAVSFTLTVSTSQTYPEVVVGVTPVYTDDGSLWYVTAVTEAVTPTVNLSQGDNPDGTYVTLATEAVTPTLAGVEVDVVVSTTATMPGGDYTASIVGVSAGVSKTLNLNLTVQEPNFELRAGNATTQVNAQTSEVLETSEVSATLTEGGSASVTISADRFYGESDPVSLGVLGAPAGLLYSLSPSMIYPDQSATLAMTDTELLENGTYTMTVNGFDGENTSSVDVTLKVEKPGFSLTTPADHQTAAAGETAIFTLELTPIQGWAYPITLELDQFSYVPDATVGFAQNPGDPPADTLTVTAPATVYLVVATGANTDEITYRLGVGASSQDKNTSLDVYLEVAAADSADVGVDQPDNLTVVAGTSYTYTITVHNYGPAAAQNVVLTDTLPTSYVTFNSAPGCSETSGVVTCNLGDLARDQEASVQIELGVDADAPAGTQLTNQAQVGLDGNNRNEDNNQQAGTALVSREADVAVSKAAPGQAVAGTAMQYTLTVTNNGPSEATGVTVSDALPSSVTFDSASAGCSYSEFVHRVSCDLGSLASQNTQQVTINVTVDPAQRDPLANSASVSANEPDPDPANNTSSPAQTTVSAQVDLQVSHTVDNATPDEGDKINLITVITNGGPSTATNLAVSGDVPSGLSQSGAIELTPSGAGAVKAFPQPLSGLSLDPGESITLTYQATVIDGPANITSQVEATCTEHGTPVSDSATINVGNVAPVAQAGGPYEVIEGKRVVLAGQGTDRAKTSDTLTYEWDLDGDGVFGETGDAAERGDETGAYPTYHAPLVDTTTDVTVTLRVHDEDGGWTDSTVNITILFMELTLVETDAPDPVRAGNKLTYRITISSTGDAPADGVVMTYTLPAYTTLASFSPSKGWWCDDGTPTRVCNITAMPVGATAVFTVVADVDRGTPANQELVFAATTTSSGSYTSATESTIAFRTQRSQPGDCNADLTTDAADITSMVLRIFTGAFREVEGCDANEDTVVDAGDISCAVRIIFEGPGACSTGGSLGTGTSRPKAVGPGVPSGDPVLSMPWQVGAETAGKVAVPVHFTASGHPVSSLTFSVDYDENRFSFDPTDADGDGIPDSVVFNLPSSFSASVAFDEGDTDGELDIFIADVFPPLTALPEAELLTITLDVDRLANEPAAPATFSQNPPASFGNTSGHSVAGTTEVERLYRVYLPVVPFSSTPD